MIWSPGLRPGTGNAAIVLFRVVAFSPAFSVYAAAPLDAQQAMDLITNTADRICNVVSTKGDAESSEAKGEVKAVLSGLAAKLADVGVSSSGSINSDQYQNVLRQDLASTLKNNAECKLKVFDTLQAKLLSSDPARTSAGVEAKPPGQLCSDRAGYPVGRWAIITKSRSSGEFSEFIILRDRMAEPGCRQQDKEILRRFPSHHPEWKLSLDYVLSLAIIVARTSWWFQPTGVECPGPSPTLKAIVVRLLTCIRANSALLNRRRFRFPRISRDL